MRTHGLPTTARRGGPDGGPCPCPECAPVFRDWCRDKTRRARRRKRLRDAAADPAAFPLKCRYCTLPMVNAVGKAVHEHVQFPQLRWRDSALCECQQRQGHEQLQLEGPGRKLLVQSGELDAQLHGAYVDRVVRVEHRGAATVSHPYESDVLEAMNGLSDDN